MLVRLVLAAIVATAWSLEICAQAMPDQDSQQDVVHVYLSDLLKTPKHYDGQKIRTKGFLYGSPHGMALVDSFDFRYGLPIQTSAIDEANTIESAALSAGMTSWADKKNPWVYVEAVGILRFDKATGSAHLDVLRFSDVQYWQRKPKPECPEVSAGSASLPDSP